MVLLVISITPASASQIGSIGLKDSKDKLQQDTNGVTQHGNNIVGYVTAIWYCLGDIWGCTCFIASNWWKWGEIWSHICQIALDAWHINENIDSTTNEGSGTFLSLLQLLFTDIDAIINEKEITEVILQDSKSDMCFINGAAIKNDTIVNTAQNDTVQEDNI